MAALCSGQLPRAQQGVEFAVPLQAEPQLLQNVSQLLKPSTVFHSRIFQTWTFLVWSTNYLAVTCCKDWTFHLVLASYWYYRYEINAPIQHLLFLLLCNAHIFFCERTCNLNNFLCKHSFVCIYILNNYIVSNYITCAQIMIEVILTSKIYLKLSTLLKKHTGITS